MVRGLFVILLLALFGSSMQAIDKGKIEGMFKRGYDEYIKTGQKSVELQEALEELQFPGLFRRNYKKSEKNIVLCSTCKVAMGSIISAHRSGIAGNDIAEYIINLCIDLNIEPEHICRGTINVHTDTLVYILDEVKDLTSQRVCAVLLQSMGCKDRNAGKWEITIPPPLTSSNEKNISRHSLDAEPLKVLHLTDIHYDPDYTVGSNAACKEPLCCQPGTKPATELEAAGYWGDYRGCDTSWTVLTDSLSHIVTQHKKIDYFYYTGDIIDHKVWVTNIEHNTESISKVLKQFKSDFGDVPVYPILGNHEPHPVNAFSSDGIQGPQISTQWIFDLSVEQWQWLPKETHETILKGGYYTTLVKAGYRIVALNSNVCFTFNWWLIYDDVDPFGQLEWLVKVLAEAEKNGEKVHILSHVPTADDSCWKPWGREYAKIVRRFASTIAAQFNGHTHKKENTIYFATDDLEQPVSVAFNGGSLTTYHNVNPNYVIYDIDPASAEVQDYELWIYDVDKANEVPELAPAWFKLYSFKDAYKVASLNPIDMAKLAKEFTKNQQLVDQYYRFKYRNSRPANELGCDDDCHLENLCYMVTSHYGYDKHCKEIEKLWLASKSKRVGGV